MLCSLSLSLSPLYIFLSFSFLLCFSCIPIFMHSFLFSLSLSHSLSFYHSFLFSLFLSFSFPLFLSLFLILYLILLFYFCLFFASVSLSLLSHSLSLFIPHSTSISFSSIIFSFCLFHCVTVCNQEPIQIVIYHFMALSYKNIDLFALH